MPTCVRCGKKTSHVEYGADGLPYCEECKFYGLNKQCSVCRLYLPYNEMKLYKGQWVCPNCYNDLREETDAKAVRVRKRCSRCGRTASILYIYEGKKLCRSCLEEEQSKWGTVGGGPAGSGVRFSRIIKVKKEESLLEKFIAFILSLLGIRKEEEIIVVKPKKRIKAKPKTEGIRKKEYGVKTEGIIRKPKKHKKSKK